MGDIALENDGLLGANKTLNQKRNESGLSFPGATTSDMKANYLGQSGNRVKNLFERARSQSPSILFIDDSAIVSRMEQQINIPMPDNSARIRLLNVMLKGKKIAFPLGAGANFLASFSDGMPGRDIRSWIARAEQTAIARAISRNGPEHFTIDLGDFKDYAVSLKEKETTVAAT